MKYAPAALVKSRRRETDFRETDYSNYSNSTLRSSDNTVNPTALSLFLNPFPPTLH